VKRNRAIAVIVASLVLLLALSFGAKWIIFDTLLEPDDTGRQRIPLDQAE
jgi:hypothetical protein